MFYFRSDDEIPEVFDPEDDRWVEIWNDVFMEFYKDENGVISELPKKNVDTGMGVERTTAILEGVNDNYTSSIWKDVIEKIEEISSLPYEGNEKPMRIIADHIRTSVFILADYAFIKPSNTDQGYILRRLIRRTIRYAKMLNIDIDSNFEEILANLIIDKYKKYYKELEEKKLRKAEFEAGREAGHEAGFAEGENHAALEIASRMLQSDKFSLDEIANFSGLSIAEVKKLCTDKQ